MYILTYLFKNTQHAIQLHFDNLQAAVDGMNKEGNIHDDYGCVAFIDSPSVGACYITDMEKELKAQERVEILKARAMVRAQNTAKSDPSLLMIQGIGGAKQ